MKKLLTLSVALLSLPLSMHASTVGWSATGGTLADVLGTAVPVGSALIKVGSFSISDATIQSDFSSGNIFDITSHFTQYNTTTRFAGEAPFGPGHWSYSDTNPATGFLGGSRVYMLTFNTTTGDTSPGNQMGIFTGAYGSSASE